MFDDRRRSKAEERRYSEMMTELYDLETWNSQRKLKERMLPRDWRKLEETAPTKPRKVRVTTGLDEDVARWFRGLGAGYQARMNQVLRIYMLAMTSKEIGSSKDKDWKGDPI